MVNEEEVKRQVFEMMKEAIKEYNEKYRKALEMMKQIHENEEDAEFELNVLISIAQMELGLKEIEKGGEK